MLKHYSFVYLLVYWLRMWNAFINNIRSGIVANKSYETHIKRL